MCFRNIYFQTESIIKLQFENYDSSMNYKLFSGFIKCLKEKEYKSRITNLYFKKSVKIDQRQIHCIYSTQYLDKLLNTILTILYVKLI
jgi:hypothetical protein